MNIQDRINQLKSSLLENASAPIGNLKRTDIARLLETFEKSSASDDFDKALNAIELYYMAEKLNYLHVQRRMIEESISELKGNQAITKAKKAIAKTSSTVWNDGIIPAANHTVVPAAAAVQGFFKGLFGKSK